MINEELEKELDKTKDVLGTLIAWLGSELGAHNVTKLLDKLEES